MNKRTAWFWAILLLSPLMVAAGFFMGLGWEDPSFLFQPSNAGIFSIRLWRVVAGLVVGASLGVAGVVLQAVLRNPLAEPYVLGLSSGAGLGIAVCVIAGGSALGMLAFPMAGFIGAVLSLAIVYALARVGRITSPHTLILAGVVWSSLCGSILMFIVSQASVEGLHAIMWWFLGDLQVFDKNLIWTVGILNGLVLLLISFFARHLNALMLGEEMAGHIGLDPEKAKMILLLLAAVISASSVAISGLIAFVGLTAPHAARALVGPDHRKLLPASACLGAAFLVAADGLGRILLFPIEVPVGVITAFVGAPFFLLLLRRRQKEVWT